METRLDDRISTRSGTCTRLKGALSTRLIPPEGLLNVAVILELRFQKNTIWGPRALCRGWRRRRSARVDQARHGHCTAAAGLPRWAGQAPVPAPPCWRQCARSSAQLSSRTRRTRVLARQGAPAMASGCSAAHRHRSKNLSTPIESLKKTGHFHVRIDQEHELSRRSDVQVDVLMSTKIAIFS